MKYTETSLQERLRNGDARAFEWVYNEYRDAFLAFGRGYKMDEDELLDVYQDSVIALFQNFVEKQTELDKSTVKTYLFGIGKFLILASLRRNAKLHRTDSFQDEIEEISLDLPDESERSQQLAHAFGKLGEKCQELLRLFYYRGLSIKEIVTRTEYKDENTVKSRKSRCMKRLRETIKSN